MNIEYGTISPDIGSFIIGILLSYIGLRILHFLGVKVGRQLKGFVIVATASIGCSMLIFNAGDFDTGTLGYIVISALVGSAIGWLYSLYKTK